MLRDLRRPSARPRPGSPSCCADMLGHELVVAGDDLHRDAVRRSSARSAVAGARLGRVEEGREAGEHQLALRRAIVAVRMVRAAPARQAMPSTRNPSSLEIVDSARARARRRRVERRAPRRPSALVAACDRRRTSSGAPFTTSSASSPSLDAAPRRGGARSRTGTSSIFSQAADIDLLVREDRLVERALQARLEEAVEIGELEHALARPAPRRRRGAPARICASVSVPVLSVHSTSMLPRSGWPRAA